LTKRAGSRAVLTKRAGSRAVLTKTRVID